MPIVLLVHLVVAAAVGLGGRRLGRTVFLVGALAPLSTVVFAAAIGRRVLDGDVVTSTQTWVEGLGLSLDTRVDAFAWLMLLIVAGIGVLVFVYAHGYFAEQPGLGRFAATLVLFGAAMTGLVSADNLLAVFVFWEMTSITSYGLIGFKDTSSSARAAATQALLITGAGGLVLLAGVVLLTASSGASSLSALATMGPGAVHGTTASVAAALILVGAFTKSAQVPFHGWLPGAMAAPTPVSAYLHSATMVKAGVFLVARLSPSLGHLPPWRPMTITVGLLTMLWGGYQALRQVDLKLLLAFGTVSQLGMLIAVFGGGGSKLLFAGTAVLLAHAVFKASLFMVVGIIDHATGTRDLRLLDHLGRRVPLVAVAAAIASLSMMAMIGTYGFVAKEAALAGLLHTSIAARPLIIGAFVIGATLTTAYTLRFWFGAFGRWTTFGETCPPVATVTRPPSTAVWPVVLLAGPTVVFGLFPSLAGAIVRPAARALLGPAGEHHLHLWPGWNLAFGLSIAALLAGGVLFVAAAPIERLQQRLDRPWTSGSVFSRGLRGVLDGSASLTGLIQFGSLPGYLATILVASLAIPAVALLPGWVSPDGLRLAESPLQFEIAALIAVAALGVAVVRRRFAAVMALGGVGVGMTAVFVQYGAPDLALTQMLVETVVIVVYVLVLRRLPDHFPRQASRRVGALRIAVAAFVGICAFALMLNAASLHPDDPVDTAIAERAYPDGDGRNVVNVILVDTRGFDTVGEASVLLAAALGVAAVVRAGKRATP